MGKTKNVQSLERAASILELFEENNKPKSVKEIVSILSLSKSTVFGLINTLANLGYLSQDPETLKYSLGLKILSLGNSASGSNLLAKTANPHLTKLSFRFQETCLLAIEEAGFVVYIDKTESPGSIAIRTRIGTKKELYCTGVGKCFLAYMQKSTAENILSLGTEPKTPNTITEIHKIWEELAIIRSQGYAFDNEEFELGINCLAVPVFNRNKDIIASICLTGPTGRIKGLNTIEIVEALKETADAIRHDMNC